MESKLKVALVHDYLVDFGGAERVLIALHEIWPQAPVYLALVNPQGLGRHWAQFRHWVLRPSWFQKLPFASRLISPFRFLLPYIWESFDLSGYDLVISSSAWAMSKAVITAPHTLHICYCHTPPRFLYHYPSARHWQKYFLIRFYANFINHRLRLYDYASSQRVDYFIANSREVARRVAKFWHRRAIVIRPPINFPSRLAGRKKQDFYLYASRLVSYKHPLLAIRACQKMKRKLVVVGKGPMVPQVADLANKSRYVQYLGHVSDKRLWELLQQARAVIFPVEKEDLGMVPLEAAAMGTPTIGYYSGGVKETIKRGKTGLFFHQLSVSSLAAAIRRFEKQKWSSRSCRLWARHFSVANFQSRLRRLVRIKLNAAGRMAKNNPEN